VLLAGLLQFTRWKSRLLACCHRDDRSGAIAGSGSALRAGFRLGLRCVCCCANLTAVLLVVGVMDLRAMAVITLAICAERLAPARGGVPRLIGVMLLLYGSLLFVAAWRAAV
jgi:predicted metal-binding membrane protein